MKVSKVLRTGPPKDGESVDRALLNLPSVDRSTLILLRHLQAQLDAATVRIAALEGGAS